MSKDDSAMSQIWEKLPKNDDGTITYLAGDIAYLYNYGFVETKKFTLEQWTSAFKGFLDSKGQYTLKRADFLSLAPFRLVPQEPLKHPFDPQKIEEGAWDDDMLEILYSESVAPSSTITEEIFWKLVNKMKSNGFVDGEGTLKLNAEFKKNLAYLIEKMPSERRKLENEVARIKKSQAFDDNIDAIKSGSTDFIVGKTLEELHRSSLKNFEGSEQKPAPIDPKKPTHELKDFKRPPTRFRG